MSHHETMDIGNGMTRISVSCIDCGDNKLFDVKTSNYDRWANGELIQRAMPEVPEGDREILISGMCGDCFDKMWADDDDE